MTLRVNREGKPAQPASPAPATSSSMVPEARSGTVRAHVVVEDARGAEAQRQLAGQDPPGVRGAMREPARRRAAPSRTPIADALLPVLQHVTAAARLQDDLVTVGGVALALVERLDDRYRQLLQEQTAEQEIGTALRRAWPRLGAEEGGAIAARLRGAACAIATVTTPEERAEILVAGSYARALVGATLALPGFALLPETDRLRLLRLVGGNESYLAPYARAALTIKLYTPGFSALQAAEQAGHLALISESIPQEGSIVESLPLTVSSRAAASLSGPEQIGAIAFASGTVPALRYEAVIGGRTYPIVVTRSADDAQGNFHTAEQVAAALAMLPSGLRRRVAGVNIEPGRNPADGSLERAFDMPGFRSHMSASADGVLSVYPLVQGATQETLDRTMLHEAGHLLDFNLRADGDAAAADWDRAMASDGRSPSAYARKTRAEDFAEATALYLRVLGTPEEASVRRLFPERFRILDEALLDHPETGPD